MRLRGTNLARLGPGLEQPAKPEVRDPPLNASLSLSNSLAPWNERVETQLVLVVLALFRPSLCLRISRRKTEAAKLTEIRCCCSLAVRFHSVYNVLEQNRGLLQKARARVECSEPTPGSVHPPRAPPPPQQPSALTCTHTNNDNSSNSPVIHSLPTQKLTPSRTYF